jgi:puromycin-sensitive aminopeptidase
MPLDPASASPGDAGASSPDEAYRLPRTIDPEHYRLCFTPDLDEATFEGTASIDVIVNEPVREIVVNAVELAISDVTIEADGQTLALGVEFDPANDRVTLSAPSEIPPGPAVLRCSFAGTLNDQLTGFYRSVFTDDAGVKRTIATTQMEPTDARKAFPCWDEPDRKAIFEITLVIDPDLHAYSNSPIVEETDEGAKRRIRFAPTMKMSSYLVAMIVGSLEASEPVVVNGVPIRVIAVPGRGHLSGFALEVAAHSLAFFADYFDIPYPADKLDLAAIPDFAMGAMENLGCVTFRETALLADPSNAARLDLERVADVVAHEIAHMWFGDLVTMRWWEGIWLNEAFATFMEILCVDAFRPQWQRWVSFGTEREMALSVDGLHSTRPIEYPVGAPAEVEGMFDVLTYQKGGSVLRMLEQFLGAAVFRDGVRLYLRAHSYANTVTSDLWDALEEVSGQPVRAMMDTWILQGGHPLVELEGATLSQRPFTYGPQAPGTSSAIGSRWDVPVLVRAVGTDTEHRVLLQEVEAPLGFAAELPLLNAGGWGTYRIGYESTQLGALGDHLDQLTPLEKSNLFADTWAGALSGHALVEDFFGLGAKLGAEAEPSTWSTLAGALALCHRVVSDDDRKVVASATRALLGARAAQIGWEPVEGEGERIPNLRASLIDSLGTIGQDEGTIAQALARFAQLVESAHEIDPDIEGAVLNVVAHQLRPGDYEEFEKLYRTAPTPHKEIRYLHALAAFPDVELCLRTFSLALDEVRSQDVPYLVLTLLTNRIGGAAVWGALTEHWDQVLAKIPASSHARMLAGVRVMCGDPALADQITAFLVAHPLAVGERTVTQTLERLSVNVGFGVGERDRLATVLSQTISR